MIGMSNLASQSFQLPHLQPPMLGPLHHPNYAALLQGPHLWVPTITPFGPILVLQPLLPTLTAPPQVPTMRCPAPQANPSFCPWRPWEEETTSSCHQVPLSNPLTEEQRTAIEPHASFPGEVESLIQQGVRFSSSTSSEEQRPCNSPNQVDLTGSEAQGSKTGHGDSGVEADLSALNLHEDDASELLVQELGTTVCQESIAFTAGTGEGTQDNASSRKSDCGESPTQACQRRKGKSMKRKEVMMSFGMVKCDGGVRQEQKTVIKEGEQMEEDGWRTDNIHHFQCK